MSKDKYKDKYWTMDIPQKHFQTYRVSMSEAVTIEQALEIVRNGGGELVGKPILVEALNPEEYPWYHVNMDDKNEDKRGGYAYIFHYVLGWKGEKIY